jgi:hypothetical protein
MMFFPLVRLGGTDAAGPTLETNNQEQENEMYEMQNRNHRGCWLVSIERQGQRYLSLLHR